MYAETLEMKSIVLLKNLQHCVQKKCEKINISRIRAMDATEDQADKMAKRSNVQLYPMATMAIPLPY